MCERATLAESHRQWEHPFPGTTDQVRHVRAALRGFLGDCPVTDDVVQLLSELSANAIAHSDSGKAGGTFTVRAEHFVNGYVCGEVEDQGSSWDGDLSRSARHPHGLYLLEQLASDYGVERIRRVHVVWFRIDYRPRRSFAATPVLSTPSTPTLATACFLDQEGPFHDDRHDAHEPRRPAGPR
jgi:serine/threonine-protein kinase RsbW